MLLPPFSDVLGGLWQQLQRAQVQAAMVAAAGRLEGEEEPEETAEEEE